MNEHLKPYAAILGVYGRDKAEGGRLAAERLGELDKALGKVAEPLVDLLIAKGVISVSDLSPEVRRIMAERHSLRVLIKVTT